MRILVFGASGFIGSYLTRFLDAQGHEVIAFCRTGSVKDFSGQCIKWNLKDSLNNISLDNFDCAIHLAHDFNGVEGANLTFNQTIFIVKKLRGLGVKRQIFFSSYSAGCHAKSIYGKTKFAIETSLYESQDIAIVRPGLVLGDGGIYGRISYLARRLPVILLPDGGLGAVPVIDIESLSIEVLSIATAKSILHEYNLFEKKLRTLLQLVVGAAAEVRRNPLIIAIPSPVVISFLKLGQFLHIPLPVNADNLIGFLANQSATHVSTLKD